RSARAGRCSRGRESAYAGSLCCLRACTGPVDLGARRTGSPWQVLSLKNPEGSDRNTLTWNSAPPAQSRIGARRDGGMMPRRPSPAVYQGGLRPVATPLLAVLSLAQARPAPRDLEGVWAFATLTPLERPAEFEGKATVSEAEAAAWAEQQLDRGNRDRRDGGAAVDVGRAINDYWFERGTALAKIDGRRITSLVVDPPDGHVPAMTPQALPRAAGRAADT